MNLIKTNNYQYYGSFIKIKYQFFLWINGRRNFDPKEGRDLLIGFNPKFLMDVLRVIDDEEINIYLVNPKAPCYIKDDAGTYNYLILPVNFNH